MKLAKQKEVERLKEQLTVRLPRVTELDADLLNTYGGATLTPLYCPPAVKTSSQHSRKTRSVPYAIKFHSSGDLFWLLLQRANPVTQKLEERIFVQFNGLDKLAKKVLAKDKVLGNNIVFEICCDRSQLADFRQCLQDWQTFASDKKRFSTAQFLLRSAELVWRKDESNNNNTRKGKVAQTEIPEAKYQLYLHCTIGIKRRTSEGLAQINQKIGESARAKLDSYDKRSEDEELTTAQQDDIEKTKSLLKRTENLLPRSSKPPYEGKSHIIVGVSFGQLQPLSVAVVDVKAHKLITGFNARQLLGNNYEKLSAYRLKQRHHATQRRKLQKQGKPSNITESATGKNLNYLMAKAVVEIAKRYQSGSIALPQLKGLREAIQSEIIARAEEKYPGDRDRQDKYALEHKKNLHR